MFRILSLLLFFMTSCNKKSPSKEISFFIKPIEKNLIIDPSLFRLIDTYIFLDSMTIRLIDVDRTGKYYNLLAQDIKIENNRKDYTITLKEAFFSDGSLITAHDVVQSFKRLILFGSPHSDPKSFIREAQSLKSREDKIEGLRVIDKKTLFIGLNNPMKEIFYFLQLADYGVLHHSQYNKNKLTAQDWTKVTSGAYHLHYNGEAPQFIANKKTLPYHPKMPQVINFYFSEVSSLLEKLKKEKVHFGSFYFREYFENQNTINQIKHLDIYARPHNLITYLVLNLNSKKFKNQNVRKWFLKKVIQGFFVDHDNPQLVTKAFQYFLPGARGHLSKEKVLKKIKLFKTEQKTPSELQKGIVIKTTKAMRKYIIPDLGRKIEAALNIPVQIDFSTSGSDYTQLIKEKNYDILLTGAGMSYKVLGEALNFVYTSKPPLFLDPSGEIKKLLQKYQQTDIFQQEESYIHSILLQMIEDAEFVPLFYTAKPYFMNKRILSGENVSFNEVPQLWKFRVK